MSDPRIREIAPPDARRRPPAAGRKVYRRPELTPYGTVAQVIRGQASTHNGDFNGGATKMCWIAEALYGVEAPRTLLVRAWLTACEERGIGWARLAVPLYRHCGRSVARAVRASVTLRALGLRLFDGAVRRAHREYAAHARRSPSITPPA